MGINDKNNNTYGKDPDFGAIFMSNSDTRRECFKKGLFGLPSTEIQFVEKVKAGMILFLFDYENRQLHGVFQASSDGAINIVPYALTKLEKQFPAQVKFNTIWSCKPLPEKSFRDAIRENYFTANKFNFGLSENQVHKLLYLFSKTRLETEAPPGRQLSRRENLKSDQYPLGGRSVDHGMHIERVQNKQDVGGSTSPVIMHRRQGDSLLYNGEVEYPGLNASDIKQGMAAQFAVDSTTSEYVSDYLGLKDASRFTAYENGDYMDICLRPNIIGSYSRSPSDKIRNHGEGRLSISDRLLNKSLPETNQRILFSNDVPGLHNSDVIPSDFYSKHLLEHNSLFQNWPRPTSTMIHPIQSHILNNTCAAQADANSKSSSLLYDLDVPGLNFSRASSSRIHVGLKPIMESTSPSNNFGRNSFGSQPYLICQDLKDTSRWHTVGGDLRNSALYSSNRDMRLNMVQNSDQLAAESVVYEACDIPSLSPSIPPPDIGRSSSLHDPFSSLFYNHQSWSGNNFHSTTLQENLSHDTTLQKDNDMYTPSDISWEGHFNDGDPLIHEYDIGCYGGSQNNKYGYPKKKSSVFSRLSFMQDISKQENGNNVRNEEYDFHTVDAVMERVRLSHNKWVKKRKPKLMHTKVESVKDKTQISSARMKNNKAENLKDKTQISSSRMKDNKAESLKDKTQISSLRMKEGDCFENTLTDQNMDLTTATGGNTNKTAEDTCFVDFKRRSRVRKLNDEIRSSNESEKNESLVLGQQKRRKLIRPNFRKSVTSDDKGIDLGASQNLLVPSSLGSYNVKDVKESCCVLVQTADNIKADAEVRNEDQKISHARGYTCREGRERATDSALAAFNDKLECLSSIKADSKDAEVQNIGRTHSKDKNSSHARGYVCGEGGEKEALNDGSKCLENINQNVFASASGKDKSCPLEKGLCSMDSIKPVSLNTESLHSICQEHHAHKTTCGGRGINTDKEVRKDCGSSFTIEVKDGSEDLQNSGDEKAPVDNSCPIKEGLHVMDSLKTVSAGTNSGSICQEHHTGKIICTGRGSSTKEEMSKDCGSFVAGVVKHEFDCLQNSNNVNASIANSSFKEGLCMTDGKKSVSQSLPSICQECHVNKVRCAGAGRVIKTEERMLEDGNEAQDGSDGSQNSGNEAQDGSDGSQNSGNEDNAAPITPCELHKMA